MTLERLMDIVGEPPANFSGERADYAIGIARLCGPFPGAWSEEAQRNSPGIAAWVAYATKRNAPIEAFTHFIEGFEAGRKAGK